MRNLTKELSEVSAKLKESVSNKAHNLDEKTTEHIELIKSVKLEVSILAEILCAEFGRCNAKISCDTGSRCGPFEIMLSGAEIFVHCPGWDDEGKNSWATLNEINLNEAIEIAEYLIEMNKNEKNIQTRLV